MLAANAAQQSSLRRSLDSVNARSASLSALNDSITETDVAQEVSSLAKSQLLSQSASSAMVQTNVSAEGVVKALWGEISSGIDWYQPEIQKSILPKIAFA
jgi:flagellin-like hook-associated protein FlgL